MYFNLLSYRYPPADSYRYSTPSAHLFWTPSGTATAKNECNILVRSGSTITFQKTKPKKLLLHAKSSCKRRQKKKKNSTGDRGAATRGGCAAAAGSNWWFVVCLHAARDGRSVLDDGRFRGGACLGRDGGGTRKLQNGRERGACLGRDGGRKLQHGCGRGAFLGRGGGRRLRQWTATTRDKRCGCGLRSGRRLISVCPAEANARRIGIKAPSRVGFDGDERQCLSCTLR